MRGFIMLLAVLGLALAPTAAAGSDGAGDAAGHCVKVSGDWGASVNSYGCLMAADATVESATGGLSVAS